MERVLVIAPDKPSGDAFAKAIGKYGVAAETMYADIEPRVLGKDMNPDPKVEADLANAIALGYSRGFRTIAIACNTLQLWLSKAKALLPRDVARKIHVVTTFEVLRHNLEVRDVKPVWLGTSVMVKAIPFEHFPTLVSLHMDDLQKKVQEIIWRTKAVTGADVSTADSEIQDLGNPKSLAEVTTNLVNELRKHGINSLILGCTELPIAFNKHLNRYVKKRMELIDPAEIMGQYLKTVI